MAKYNLPFAIPSSGDGLCRYPLASSSISEKCVADTYKDSTITPTMIAIVERRRRPASRVNTLDNIARADGIQGPSFFVFQRPGDEGIRCEYSLSAPKQPFYLIIIRRNGERCLSALVARPLVFSLPSGSITLGQAEGRRFFKDGLFRTYSQAAARTSNNQTNKI